MLRIKNISEVIGKYVHTSDGDFFGQVDDVNLSENKIDGWKIKVGSGFLSMFGGAKGVIIPHQFVRAIGDVMIINKNSLPVGSDGAIEMPQSSELTD
ncbi:PRC-barrel domain-containing protein [Candidatus Pacearchaeota archaeon]|nr:PRC-barrel domain-containing protein [Candidatus Pacearchaeota archaeon]